MRRVARVAGWLGEHNMRGTPGRFVAAPCVAFAYVYSITRACE